MKWEQAIGLGVAGNFAGHLEQAGEANDFKDLTIDDATAPKGVFPFYVPGPGDHFLHTYPISPSQIRLGAPDEKHQIEPEVALLCNLQYEGDRVVQVEPIQAMAHNDCSIRRPGAKKISEKKNWGMASKGTADQAIPIDRFTSEGILDRYRLASFLMRNGRLHEYGVDSSVSSYSYMYERLLDWLLLKLNDQVDEGPLENIAHWIQVAGRPKEALISIGATQYTEFGETHFLEAGDQLFVALYDSRALDLEGIRAIAEEKRDAPQKGLSFLRQDVVPR